MECQRCKKGLSKRGLHFVCQGQCQGIFHRSCVKGLTADLKAGKKRIHCNNCEEDESEIEDQEEEGREPDEILKDIQKNVRAIPGLLQQLESIKHSMSLLSDKYDTLLSEHKKSKEKIHKLEKTVEHINNKCTYLEKNNVALEQRVHDFEQTARKHNIEIVGIEPMPDENVKEVVDKIGKIINVSSEDIEWVRRNQPRKQGLKQASIIVGFKTSGTESRDAWLSQRRKLTDVTSDKITGGTNNNKIYINEDLTKETRTLLWKTKKELHRNYKFIWVSKGKILVKKTEEDNSIWVRTDNDISDLLKTTT
ncbi:unnamed protein product [Chrysodeixis includens]|uniref:FP protein C-terminal domain-containing protein n=1 Tax=Chrysodeixis includens TaxID=689277 RepID=A0A9N8KUR0_CHRIL|nr:unnamed protein product [Chrysodeixis includens]